MALKRTFSEEDFNCPVCCEVYTEPVLLTCGHSVCRTCVHRSWRTGNQRKCPLCRTRCCRNPPLNLALRNLCETFREVHGDPEALCELHGEKLKLFCVEDAQLACLVCRDSSKHLQHRFRPVDEAAVELKDIIKSALTSLTLASKNLQDAQFASNQSVKYITEQTENIQNQIREEFKKLFKFLKDEKKAMMMMVDEESERQTEKLNERCKEMEKEMNSLLKTIKEIKQELQSEDIRFIKNFEKTLEKTQKVVSTSDLDSTAVVDAAKYLGNLQFNVWRKMQDIITYTPVVLDPNTAHTQLVLSSDLTSVGDKDDDYVEEAGIQRPPCLEVKERFCVLGSEGFSTGIHCWDVEVKNNTFWMLGVTSKSVRGKRQPGTWGIGYDSENLCARSPVDPLLYLSNSAALQVVRVRLDLNAGEVWFLDAANEAVIHMFSHHFTEKVFPFFQTLCSLSPLRIVPLQPFVVLRKLHQCSGFCDEDGSAFHSTIY